MASVDPGSGSYLSMEELREIGLQVVNQSNYICIMERLNFSTFYKIKLKYDLFLVAGKEQCSREA